MPDRSFTVFLTHTSRSWEWEKCRREYLRERYGRPGRLDSLPQFDALPPNRSHTLYTGGLTILKLALHGSEARLSALRCIDSRYKIQHACLAGERLVLCFEDFLFVLPDPGSPLEAVKLERGAPGRIDDPWFGGLHTVFAADSRTVVVSAAGSDAVLWVDVDSGRVTRRWRLPAEIYGSNYALTPEMSVQDHYIHNDIQLGHLNCAYPDSHGGCWISTLAQGDIGYVRSNGGYEILARGFIGCHGVRLAAGGETIYFADSCGGRLMAAAPSSAPAERVRLDSRWLHDAAQLEDDIYLFSLGDRNELSVIDVGRGVELGRYSFESRGVNVQFLSVVGTAAGL
jgi:hypothetical protein